MVLRYARVAMLASVLALAACGGGGGSSGSSADAGDAGDSGTGGGTNPPPVIQPPPTPEAYPDIPATDADAARFLTQATFGPTDAEIANLRKIGYRAWLDEQLSETTAPPTLMLPHLQQLVANGVLAEDLRTQNVRNYWLWQAATAHDQLRMRMGFALSEIFVVSDLDLPESNGFSATRIADYQDVLAQDAFGTYRTVLEDVTLHPAMGYFLTYVGNQKTDTTNNIAPDENYGREVMQLMSIGLYQRNRDFSPLLDSNGNTIPTYDQSVVSAMSRVFTGWTYAGQTDKNYGKTDNESTDPMECHPAFHDTAAKTIFNGIVINGGSDCTADLAATLDALADHANTAPFISRQLIQRFVTSNPSPAYIERVVDAWDASGGDLGEVIRSILLDDEARLPPTDDNAFGKSREPLIKIATVWRSFNASYVPPSTGEVKFTFTGATDLMQTLSQDSQRAPSVFNFFSPDFRLPSTDGISGIYAPEFQILTEATYLGAVAQHDDVIWLNTADQPPPTKLAPILDITGLIAQAQAQDYAGMVDKVNLLLFYGTLSSGSKSMMIDMLEQLEVQGQTSSELARSLLEVAFDSPEFAIQR